MPAENPHFYDVKDAEGTAPMLLVCSPGERDRIQDEAIEAGHPEEKFVPLCIGNLALMPELVPNSND